jgi:hypothetical protein
VLTPADSRAVSPHPWGWPFAIQRGRMGRLFCPPFSITVFVPRGQESVTHPAKRDNESLEIDLL